MTSDGAVVAVISTCFNQEDLVGDTIESVIRQETAAKVLHVICDDGSTDGSLRVLRDYEARYDHIRVLSVTNRTLPGALNACLIALPDEVEYVIVLGGDDWLEANFVEECLRALTPETDMVVPAMRRIGYPRHPEGYFEMPNVRQPTAEEIWKWKITYAWAVALFRREILVEAGGFHYATEGDCDWDMWIDLVARGYRFAYTDQTWFYYRFVATSMNRLKTAKVWDEHREEMKRHHRRDTLPGKEFC